MRYYRVTLVSCVAAWFLMGVHAPVLHEMTHHGATPAASVLGAIGMLLIVAVAGLWMLLRAPARTPRA